MRLHLPDFVHKARPCVKSRVKHLLEGGILYDRSMLPLKIAGQTDQGLWLTIAEDVRECMKGAGLMQVLFAGSGPQLYRWRELPWLHFRRDSDISIPKEGVAK